MIVYGHTITEEQLWQVERVLARAQFLTHDVTYAAKVSGLDFSGNNRPGQPNIAHNLAHRVLQKAQRQGKIKRVKEGLWESC